MTAFGVRLGLCAAAALAGVAVPVAAQPVIPPTRPAAQAEARFGLVRVRIDPELGEQDAEIRQLLSRHPFVRIAEPADYLVTTQADFPLDLSVIDLRQPPDQWDHLDDENQEKIPEPRRFSIGHLRTAGTSEALTAMLTAASRLRAVLDRSTASAQGVEACVMIQAPDQPEKCTPLGGPGAQNFVSWSQAAGLRVSNGADSDRYVSTIAADGSLKLQWFGLETDPPVRKLAPGETVIFEPRLATFRNNDDPRVLLLISSRPFTVEDIFEARGGGVAMAADMAVRSFQLIVEQEPMPAMGHGTDVTAEMAVWMAQFYSIIPYTRAEIEADEKLGDETQFLALRTYEELQHRCGATLIAPNVVLTAAHCVAKGQYAGDGLAKVMKDRRVRLGTRRLGKEGQSFAIAGIAVHGDYLPKKHNHDLALLLLKPDRGSGSVRQRPIAVAERPLPGGVEALGFGWGFTGAVAPDGNIMMAMNSRMQTNPDVLQYGAMQSVTLDACRRKLADEVAPGMVCMYSKRALSGGESRDGVFTCRGDSGGPLVRKVGGRDVLVGVVAWSKGCGYKDYPSVFMDAGSYAQWIAAARAALKPGAAIRVADPALRATGAR